MTLTNANAVLINRQCRPVIFLAPYGCNDYGAMSSRALCVGSGAEPNASCQVLSAITDGLMVAIPRTLVPAYPFPKFKGQDLRSVLPEGVTRCEQWFAIQMFKQDRQNLGRGSEKWSTIKDVGARALTLKTRLYAMWLEGTRKKTAQSGFSWEQWPFETLLDYHTRSTVESATQMRLATRTEIFGGKARDRLAVPEKITLNLDPDWKWKFRADGTSDPFHPRFKASG
jgi:hypothetical protein